MKFSTLWCAHSDHGNTKSWDAHVSSRTAARWLRTLAPVFLPAILFGLVGPAQAATITVDTTSELVVADGFCSLREAITAANTDAAVDTCAAGSGADIIVLPAGTYTLATVDNNNGITGPNGLPLISTDITIQGVGAATTIISRGPAVVLPDFRFFQVNAGSLTLHSITFQSGSTVTSGNHAGALFLQGGSATIIACVFSANRAGGAGGAIMAFTGSTLLSIRDSTFSNNSAQQDGGAVWTHTPTVGITSTTFAGNTAAGSGGALAHEAGSVQIVNSTFTATNSAGGGGAIATTDAMSLNNVTITNNVSNSPTGGGGGIAMGAGAYPFVMSNTILAGNSAASTIGPDCLNSSPAIGSQGHNLVGDASSCTIVATTGDQLGTAANPINPLLALLASNGGPTQTHALFTGSPAEDAGSTGGFGLTPCEITDQRGVARPVGPVCDIGAFEGSVLAVADVGISKVDSPDPVNEFSNLTFTITVTNNGPDPAPSVVVSDPNPPWQFVSITPSQGACSGAGGVFTCNLGALLNAGTATIVFVGWPNAPGTLNNTASVTATVNDANAANDSATASTTVNPVVDLAVTKTDTPDPVNVGSNLTYTLTVTNNGPSAAHPATNVVLTDTLPAGGAPSSPPHLHRALVQRRRA